MSAFEIFRDSKTKQYSENDTAEHYKKMSLRFAVLKWISLTILIVYVIVSVSRRGDDLSLDNVRYIMRYFTDKPISMVESGDGVNFDYDGDNKAYMIGEDFAIVGKSGIIIFDFSADVLFRDNFDYDSPMAVSNGNELIVYNVGGKEIRFYNSYTMLKRLTFESPVFKVSVSSEGNYLVQTASGGYRSGVQVYDIDKELIFRHNFGELALQSSALSENGKYVACASFSSLSNIVSSTVTLFDITRTESLGVISFDGEYPLSVEFINSEYFVLFTNKGYKGYNIKLENVFSKSYGNRTPQKFRILDNKIVVSYSLSTFNQNGEIDIVSESGHLLQTINIPCQANDFELVGDKLHVLAGNNINTYSIENGEIENSYSTNGKFSHITKINEEKFMISCSDRAEMFIYNQRRH